MLNLLQLALLITYYSLPMIEFLGVKSPGRDVLAPLTHPEVGFSRRSQSSEGPCAAQSRPEEDFLTLPCNLHELTFELK